MRVEVGLQLLEGDPGLDDHRHRVAVDLDAVEALQVEHDPAAAGWRCRPRCTRRRGRDRPRPRPPPSSRTATTSSRLAGATVSSAVPAGCSVMSSSTASRPGRETCSAPTSAASAVDARRSAPSRPRCGRALISRTIGPVASWSNGSTSPSTTTIASGEMPLSMATAPRPIRTVAEVRPAVMAKANGVGRRAAPGAARRWRGRSARPGEEVDEEVGLAGGGRRHLGHVRGQRAARAAARRRRPASARRWAGRWRPWPARRGADRGRAGAGGWLGRAGRRRCCRRGSATSIWATVARSEAMTSRRQGTGQRRRGRAAGLRRRRPGRTSAALRARPRGRPARRGSRPTSRGSTRSSGTRSPR